VLRRRVDQRLDMPGFSVDLFSGLQGVAAVDKDGGFRRASSSRNRPSRAVSATPPSGSSNVWKWASNIVRLP
jgi:hypothetical protein